MSARLRLERASDGDRCANCGWWAGRDTGASIALCEQHDVKTLDLSKCSDHRAHQGVVEGDIIGGKA